MRDPETSTPPARRATSDPVNSFVGYLYGLAERDDGTARAALAELRRAASDVAQHPRALAVVGDRIPDDVKDWELDAYLLTAQLFAIYAAGGRGLPDHRVLPEPRATLGSSARYVNPRKLNADKDYIDSQPGIGSRFSALLALPAEDLPDELRRFLRLLRSKDAPVNFYQLLRDLLQWKDYDQRVQKMWARQYWASVATPESSVTSNN